MVVTTGAIRCAKLQSNHHQQQTNTQCFTGRMPFPSPMQQCRSTLSLSVRFSGHSSGEPRLAGVYWSKGWWRWWWQLDYWRYNSCKAPVKSSSPTNQHPVFFTGRMPFLSSNQQCQSTEGKNITFQGLAHPKLICGLPTLSLTTKGSWLPWRRVVMPLVSPLMQYPNATATTNFQFYSTDLLLQVGPGPRRSPLLTYLLTLLTYPIEGIAGKHRHFSVDVTTDATMKRI